jgi:hypothetical protein
MIPPKNPASTTIPANGSPKKAATTADPIQIAKKNPIRVSIRVNTITPCEAAPLK